VLVHAEAGGGLNLWGIISLDRWLHLRKQTSGITLTRATLISATVTGKIDICELASA
jgi:hypothetical protein